MFQLESPFLRGILGGVVGMSAILLIAIVVYGGWIVYSDHHVLVQVVQIINNAQKQQPAP